MFQNEASFKIVNYDHETFIVKAIGAIFATLNFLESFQWAQ